MNAEPILTKIAQTFKDARLDVILVGNAAAALQGAPVTTLDFDFMFRKTPLNLKKLKKVAGALGMSSTQPYDPASDLYRLIQKDTGIQLDFVSRLHGVKSFGSLKSHAAEVYFGTARILVADLDDIIRSKRAMKKRKSKNRRDALAALKKESDRAEREQIRLLLSLPMNRRTHFLRVRLPNGGSAL